MGDATTTDVHTCCRSGFNSATAVTPWVTRGSALTSPAISSFNSATAVTPWVTGSSNRVYRSNSSLQFGHGGDAVGDRRLHRGRHPIRWLQFGHGGDAVGDAALDQPHKGGTIASIRPRR